MAGRADIEAGKAHIKIWADKSALVRGLKSIRSDFEQIGNDLQALGGTFMRMSAVMAVPFAIGAKFAGDFERQMKMVSTMLDEPEKHMARFTAQIKDISVEFGESTATLAKGLYDLLSASVAPDKAMHVLRESMKAAKAGLTDAAVSTQAIINVLNAFKIPAENAADVTDMLFMTVKRGVTTFPELAQYFGEVTSTAAAAGISMEEAGAAIATMTRNGLKTDMAVTALTNILKEFLAPTDDASAAARKYGIELTSATLRSEGLLGVMRKLAGASPEAMAKIFPNIRGLRGAFPLAGDLKGFATDIDLMGKKAGSANAAFDKMKGGILGAFEKAWQSAIAVMVAIGETIAEPLKKVGSVLMVAGRMLVTFIDNNKTLFQRLAIGAIVVGALGASLFSLGIAFKAVAFASQGLLTSLGLLKVLMSPITLVTAAVVGLGYALFKLTPVGTMLGDTFQRLFAYLSSAFANVAQDGQKAFGAITEALSAGDIGAAANVALSFVRLEWARLVAWLTEKWDGFRGFWIELGTGILVVVNNVTAKLKGAWAEAIGFIEKAWDQWASSSFVEAISGPIAWVIAKLQGLDVADVQKNLKEGFEVSRAARPNRAADIDAQTAAAKAAIESQRSEMEANLGAGATTRKASGEGAVGEAQAAVDAAKADFLAAATKAQAAGDAAKAGKPIPGAPAVPSAIQEMAATGTAKSVGAQTGWAAAAMQGGGGEDAAQTTRKQMLAEQRMLRKMQERNERMWERIADGLTMS